MPSPLALIGATGFVGRHLVDGLGSRHGPVRALVHRRAPPTAGPSDATWITGDLTVPATLRPLLEGARTLINLASVRPADAARRAMTGLVEQAAAAGVRRIVHCSTAVVVGRARDRQVVESTECRPFTAYEKAKWAAEEAVWTASRGRLELVVVRPTSVFGTGGRNLVHLCQTLLRDGWRARAQAALFGRRRMSLVSVETVAAALAFLAEVPLAAPAEVFLVAEDDEPANNYLDVERLLRHGLGLAPTEASFVLPPVVLQGLLLASGRWSVRPDRTYGAGKLTALGFRRPRPFEEAVVEFARAYRAAHPQGGAR